MNKQKLDNIRAKAAGYIAAGRLRDALVHLQTVADSSMQFEVTDRLRDIQKNYNYMLSYLTRGVDDPQRPAIYARLAADTYGQADALHRRLLTVDCPTAYFNTVRTMRQQGVKPLSALIAAWKSSTAVKSPTPADRRTQQSAATDIFNHLWTAYPLTGADAAVATQFVTDPLMPLYIRQLAVNALVLGLMEYYDPQRLTTLMDIYADPSGDATVVSAALAGVLLGLYKYRDRPMLPSVRNRLDALADSPNWRRDIKTTFIELIRTRDTERVNAAINDVIPKMMKLGPDMLRKMGVESGELPIDPDDMNINPEWEDLLRKSGVEDRLRELSEMQQEGADVFMATFAHLKSFPFFFTVANWFLPFHTDHGDVERAGLPDNVTALIDALPFMCDSDKYSFVLSLSTIPEQQRQMMLGQVQAVTMDSEIMEPGTVTAQSLASFLKGLYRFVNLYRRKEEFYNPFAEGVNLLDVKALEPWLDDVDTVRVVAEFFFKCNYWADALQAFTRLDALGGPDGTVFQKMGYCQHRLGQLDKAIDLYHQAEIFDPDSRWLQQQLGSAYRAKGDYRQAIVYYGKLAQAEPDNIQTALTLGYAMMQDGDTAGALKQFFKVEYLEGEQGTRSLRPLAWTLFADGQTDRAARYYERVAANNPTATDYLNMGHVALAQGQYKEAINYWKLSLTMQGGDTEALIKAVRADAPHLNKAGVSDATIALTLDALLSSLQPD